MTHRGDPYFDQYAPQNDWPPHQNPVPQEFSTQEPLAQGPGWGTAIRNRGPQNGDQEFPPAMPADTDERWSSPASPGTFAPQEGARPHNPGPGALIGGPGAAGIAPSQSEFPRTGTGAVIQPHYDETAWSTEAAEQTGPRQGLRGGLAKIGIKLSKSRKEKEYDSDVLRMQRKLAHPQNVVVLALKGGVGKTTGTVSLGTTLATHRDVSDVVAFDTVTDGTLRRRMPKEKNQSVSSDVKRFLRSISERELTGSEIKVQLYSNAAGLQALVSPENVQPDEKLSGDEFNQILDALRKEHMVNLVDMSPDRSVAAFWPAIQRAHALVMVTTPNSQSTETTMRLIQLIRESNYKHLLTRTVLLWNDAAPGTEVVIDVERSKSQFVRQLSPKNEPSSCLVEIPLDPHLSAGGAIDLSLLKKGTRRQFERAAALLMDKLPDQAVLH